MPVERETGLPVARTPRETRLAAMDGLRGLAIALVLATHSEGLVGELRSGEFSAARAFIMVVKSQPGWTTIASLSCHMALPMSPMLRKMLLTQSRTGSGTTLT